MQTLTNKDYAGELIALSADGGTLATYQRGLIKLWRLNTRVFALNPPMDVLGKPTESPVPTAPERRENRSAPVGLEQIP